jgi:hypothetical protein
VWIGKVGGWEGMVEEVMELARGSVDWGGRGMGRGWEGDGKGMGRQGSGKGLGR